MTAFVPVGGLGGGGGGQDAIDGYLSVEPADVSLGQLLTTTPAKIAWWAHAGSSGVTASTSTDDLTIVTSGRYNIQCSMSGTGPASAVEWVFEVYVDGASPGAGMVFGVIRDTAVTAHGSLAFAGELDLTAGQVVTIYGWSDIGGGQTFVPDYAMFKINRIGA